jgi:small subunit ribosomal protein S12
LQVKIANPKKPNSANRSVVRIRLRKGGYVTAMIPGENHNLQTHAMVMVRGGRVRDRPGVNLKVLRGVLDASPINGRKRKRSKYGTSRR